MNDILFDIKTREIVFTDGLPSSDFSETSNPSVQNGGIILMSRVANPNVPIPGIGIQDFINSDLTNAAAQLNRWAAQVKQDGGKARWSDMTYINGELVFNSEVDYL